MTLMFRIADFEREAFRAYAREHPNQWRGVLGLWDLVRQATAAGELDLPREDILFFATPHPRESIRSVSTRVTGMLATDVWDLTRAEFVARRQLRQIATFLQKYVPGFADSYVVQSGVHVGVRETRLTHQGRLPANGAGHSRRQQVRGRHRPWLLPGGYSQPDGGRDGPEKASAR